MRIAVLSLIIAFRFIRGGWRSNIASLISIIAIISIALGVAVLIIGLSAMNGFERELNTRILSVVPHGEIEPVNPPFINWLTMLKLVEAVPGILAAAPYLDFIGLVEHDQKLQAIQVKGVDPALETRLSTLPHYVEDNAWSHFHAGQHQLIIGKGIADTIKVKSGDWVTLIISNNAPNIHLLKPKRIRLQVSGILRLNNQLDYNFVMVPLEDAQNYLQRGNDIGGIAIKVNEVFKANQLVREAGKVTDADVKTRSWIGTYGYMYHDIQMIRTMMYLAIILLQCSKLSKRYQEGKHYTDVLHNISFTLQRGEMMELIYKT